jgi:hypothetical protein
LKATANYLRLLIAAKDVPAAPVELIPYTPPLVPGEAVTVAGVGWKGSTTARFVILGESRKPNAYRIALLGGDQGRYYPSVPKAYLTVVDLAA